MRILVVEAESELARQLRQNLRRQSYSVDLATSHRQAYDETVEVEYDLVVLDPDLPDGCGFDLLRLWRREGLTTPILVVSDRDSPEDKAAGLDAGADDYLERRFAWPELMARVRCLLRRRDTKPVERLEAGNVVLDRGGQRAFCSGQPLELTARELGILEYLLLHPNRVISRAVIAEHVWDGAYEARSNVIDVLVGRLRRKLAGCGGDDDLITTVRGVGYVLRLPVVATTGPTFAEAR